MQGLPHSTETSGPLVDWVKEGLAKQNIILPSLTLVPLSGDAGMRVYYRIQEQAGFLVAASPQNQSAECVQTFAKVAAALRQQSVMVPEVYALDAERNWMLLSDLGETLFGEVLTEESVNMLYSEALMTLLQIQQIPDECVALPSYDRETLRREMDLFSEWFVGKMLNYELSDEERALIHSTLTYLEDQALEQPIVFVHRDYHSRNLMYREGIAPGVIDFQDALRGPITYDVVSLLRDCYVRWQPEQVRRWAITYANMAIELGLMPAVDEDTFLRWFDTMGLQRHIKVLGIFARLSLRDNKHNYLNDLPLVIRYTLEVARQYPKTQAFAQWFERELLPIAKNAAWYSDYERAGSRSSEALA